MNQVGGVFRVTNIIHKNQQLQPQNNSGRTWNGKNAIELQKVVKPIVTTQRVERLRNPAKGILHHAPRKNDGLNSNIANPVLQLREQP
jgi:hypothetical protein